MAEMIDSKFPYISTSITFLAAWHFEIHVHYLLAVFVYFLSYLITLNRPTFYTCPPIPLVLGPDSVVQYSPPPHGYMQSGN